MGGTAVRIQERLAGTWKRLRHPKWMERIGDSRAGRLFRRTGALASAHTFPLQILLILIYRLALDYVYLTMVCRFYGYTGFYADVQLPLYGASLMAALAFAPFVVRLQKEPLPSARIVSFINYTYFIPLTSYCGCSGTEITFFLIGIVYWALLLLFQFQLPVLDLKALQARHARQSYAIMTVLASAFVMFISGCYTGFRFTMNFIDVYGIRAEASGYDMPGVFVYTLSMMGIILAILLLYWLKRKKYLVVAALVVIYLFLFSIAAHKSLFFFLLLLLAGYFLYRPWMMRWLGGLLTLFAGAAVLEEKLTGSFYLMGLFFRRSMFELVYISWEYMEAFSRNPLSLFRDSILGKLPGISPIYTIDTAKIMGEFRGNIGENANNGLLGDMFANLPVPIGIFLLPLILVVCFRVLDATSHKLPEQLTIAVCAYFAVRFSNSSWSTTLLSGGFLIACLMLYFFPKEETLTP